MTQTELPALVERIKTLAREYRHGHNWPILKYQELCKAVDDLALMAREAVEVPPGWKLVPVEPTREMLDAYVAVEGRFHSARADWAAMLAASPEPPTREPAPIAGPIPEGWMLVPKVPTQVMCQAGQWKAQEWPTFPLRISPIYQAMLAAAPASPTKGQL